jgi:hypothetical protein
LNDLPLAAAAFGNSTHIDINMKAFELAVAEIIDMDLPQSLEIFL